MTQPNEVEIYKKALGKLAQQVGNLTLDLALAHAQLEDMHTQLNAEPNESEAK